MTKFVFQELPEEVSLDEDEIDLNAPPPSFPPEVIRTKVLGLTPTSMEEALEQVRRALRSPCCLPGQLACKLVVDASHE